MGRAELLASSPETALAPTLGTLGVCKAFLGSSLAFEVRKFVAEWEEKEAEYRDRGLGARLPEKQSPTSLPELSG